MVAIFNCHQQDLDAEDATIATKKNFFIKLLNLAFPQEAAKKEAKPKSNTVSPSTKMRKRMMTIFNFANVSDGQAAENKDDDQATDASKARCKAWIDLLCSESFSKEQKEAKDVELSDDEDEESRTLSRFPQLMSPADGS